MPDESIVELVAVKALGLRSYGNADPSNHDIAKATEADEDCTTLGPGLVRGLLPGAKDLLEGWGHFVALVNDHYYDAGHSPEEPPATDAEARACIPVGRGNQSAGIYFVRHEDDPIYTASRAHWLACGAGMVGANTNRAVAANGAGLLSNKTVVGLLQEAGRRLQPKKKLPGPIQRELMPGSGGEE